ncbi:DUF3850 domain-containing protein [Rhizobium leguminosarum]|uniref:DUF3850 domain-containing protein n=1 Tax=Rhizobium ruizarguesonis TaxID=2081791 RepID=UPI0013B6E3D0|nr:DUF3850 domain-containing protein [Rhizobium ruizarguesonis]NEJ15470.1 DUF3850 domain-containing protein [Rhizobium ruizarguesonis]NEK29545.1 DUF3850 domain-containing protein [Rhizobium ruizarguesonis]
MGHHQLKILPSHMNAVVQGAKRFEVRDNSDRGFQAGDTFELLEWEEGRYSSRIFPGVITYVTNFEQRPNWVVFGFIER